jgi:hypothetical protein
MTTKEKQILDSLDVARMLEVAKPILEQKKANALKIFGGKIELLEQRIKELHAQNL